MTTRPIIVPAPGVLILTGDALPLLRYLVGTTEKARQRDGLTTSRAIAILRNALDEATNGHADTLTPNHEAPSTRYEITTDEAARILGCSQRQARRLAPDLDGRRIGNRWLVDRQTTHEYARLKGQP